MLRKILRGTLGVPFLFCALALHAAGPDPVKLHEEKRGSDTLLWVENTDPYATRWAWVELAGRMNVRCLPVLPLGLALAPGEKRLATTFSAQDPSMGYSYALRTQSGEGDPTREPDPSAVYLLPWAHGAKHTVTQGYFGSETHQGLRALDFDLAEGTPIDAARAGTVIFVKQDSDRGGASMLFAQWGNSIEVMHSDRTWAVYAHLQKDGARVQVGQQVQAGDLLGLSGATGMANGPHLHFCVYRATYTQPASIATVFQTGPSQTSSLNEGQTYYSYHPGGASFKAVLGADLKDEDLREVTRTAQGGKVSFREQKIDQRVLIYCANGSGRAMDITVGFAQSQGVRPTTGLPYRARVPAHTETYLFGVDFIGPGRSAYELSVQYRPASPPSPR